MRSQPCGKHTAETEAAIFERKVEEFDFPPGVWDPDVYNEKVFRMMQDGLDLPKGAKDRAVGTRVLKAPA